MALDEDVSDLIGRIYESAANEAEWEQAGREQPITLPWMLVCPWSDH